MEGVDARVGTTVGRFVLQATLGEGGMGAVYLAHDPELDRRVAIKLLHPSSGAARSTIARSAQLQREAQAMAKLSHRNVVAIYDVGIDHGAGANGSGDGDDRIFIAMALVDGSSLRHWQTDAPRSWREVLAVYVQAGRGLAAAHDVGLIHLDFKPDNALIGRDGEVRVADFGLARSAADGSVGDSGSSTAGTPRYMAPEQWLGTGTDARTDQFAFCVALWEALYGSHPFAAVTQTGTPAAHGARTETVTASERTNLPVAPAHDGYWRRSVLGKRCAPPRGSPVPPRIARTLERGLVHDPGARHPDLHALLDELEAVLHPRRRRWPVAAGAALGAAGLVFVWFAVQSPASPDPCGDVDRPIDAVWGDAQELQLTTALVTTGRSEARDVARRVSEEIGRYRDSWRAMRRDACLASRVQSIQSPALFDLRMQCLDRRLGELDGVIHALTGPMTTTTLDRAIPAARELTPIAICADTVELTTKQPLPAGASVRQAILATESQIDVVDGLRRAGAYAAALARAPAIVEAARHDGHAPTLGRALELYGWLLRQTNAAEPAEATTREAIRVAADGRDAATEAAAWINLLYIVGHMRGQGDSAAILRPAAEAAVARTGSSHLRAQLATTLITALREQGKYADAVVLGRDALAAATTAIRGDDLDVAGVRIGLASALWDAGDVPSALAASRDVLAVRERILGPAHPLVGAALVLLGGLYNQSGRFHDGREALERAVRILESALGPDHPEVSTALNNLADAVASDGDLAGSLRIHQRVLAIREKAFGPDSLPVALTLNNLGQMLIENDRGAEAEPLLRKSLAIREAKFGPDHPKVADVLTNLAWAMDVTGHCDKAVPLYDRAVAIDEKAFGRDHHNVASPLSGRGLCLIDRQPAEAAIALERAARLLDDGSDPGNLALIQFGLARTLRLLGRDPARARTLAEKSRDYAVDHHDPKMRDQIDAWLATSHPH